MFPIVLDPTYVRILLIGQGPLLERRAEQLRAAGAEPHITETATEQDIQNAHVVFVAGVEEGQAQRIATQVRARGALVNVEDVLPLCDFHTPALVRRGDLLFSISTGGKSPGLAKMLRAFLEAIFPPIWAERLQKLALLREDMRKEGKSFQDITQAVEQTMEKGGWLCTKCRTP